MVNGETPMTMHSVEQTELMRAYSLLRARKLAEAESVCRNILAKSPRYAGAVHMLGLVRKDAGDLVGSERLLRQSIELEPGDADFHSNLANLLRQLGRLTDAEGSYRFALERDSRHQAARLGLARTLNDLGQHAAAETECRALVAAFPKDPQAWSALAMALRNQKRLADAEAAYRQALTVAPAHAVTHHNLGSLYVAMERAEEALAALDRAQALGVGGFEIAFNRGRALVQLYRTHEAEQAFAEAVALAPEHLEAQLNLARVRYMKGDHEFARDLSSAAARLSENTALQLLFGEVLRRAGDLAGAEHVFRDQLGRRGGLPEIRAALAALLHEMGRLQEAESEALQATAARPQDPVIADIAIGVLLAAAQPEQALSLIRMQRTRDPDGQGWIAYEATAARLLGDPLYEELYDYQRLVQIYDLEAPPGWASMAEFNRALLQALSVRHRFATHPLDQSLRNGSQTARSLVTDADPLIQAALKAFEEPIESFRRAIGTNPDHPLSVRNSGPTQFAGAWSVQLRREGFHVNHIHPQGWISSAYYVSVPEEVQDEALMSGWLKFGETRFPIAGAGPARFVQPRVGRLVLFPSYMWHGTNPIHGSEPRTTIAFDAIPARR
jgi:Flp pilus assembly protein TadD